MLSFSHLLKEFLSWREIILLIILIVCLDDVGYSQTMNGSDSSEYRAQLELFDNAIGIENTEIISGPKYSVPFQIAITDPFYYSSIAAKGSLAFNGQPYFNLPLLFDTYSDELIVERVGTTGRDWIRLYKPKIEWFSIHGHTFRNYQGIRAQSLGITSGFYDVLCENAAFTLLARRKKDTHVEMGTLQYKGIDKYLFISQGEKAAPFHGMKDFYRVLGNKDLSSELKSFVSQNSLKVKKSDDDLIAVARQCYIILNKQK